MSRDHTPGCRAALSATRRITRGPFELVRLRLLRHVLTERTRSVSAAVFSTATALVLLACLNLAGLSAGRALDRRRELSLRRALGASGGRLTRMLAIEHALVVAAGAGLGLLVSHWLLAAAVALTPAGLMFLKTPEIAARAVSFALAGAVLAVAVATGWSARAALGRDPRPMLAESGGTTERARSYSRGVLIAAQVALALFMAVAASLFAASLMRVWQEDPGFAPEHAARIRVSPPAGFNLAAIGELLQALSHAPGVVGIGGLNEPFLESAITGSAFIRPAGALESTGDVENLSVTSGFFEAAGLRAIDGRLPAAEEFDQGQPVALVSRKLAALYWPGRSAVGQSITDGTRMYEVIGVVPDARYRSLDSDPAGEIYSPIAYSPGLVNIVIAFDRDAGRMLAGTLREMAVRFPQVRVVRAETLSGALGVSVQHRRFQTWLFVSLGVAALVIAGVGILGLMGMAATRRTREVGVRMALGATRRTVIGMMLREQLAVVVVGLVAGGAAAGWAVRLLEPYVYKMSIYDARAWAAAVAVLLSAAATGTLVPALRATRIDPVRSLRVE